MNTIIETAETNDTVIFFLQTESETDFWYWQVDKTDVQNYKGTLTEFVNDERNSHLGCSVASFTTLEDAKADALKDNDWDFKDYPYDQWDE